MVEEQRQGQRLNAAGMSETQVSFISDENPERVRLEDISRSGMRAYFPKPVSIGSAVQGKLEFYFTLTRRAIPFVVRGKVVRVNETNGSWEAGIQFDKLLRGVLPA